MYKVIAYNQKGEFEGLPTTGEKAEEITKLLKGRLGLKYKIVSV
jgi:hypothetical protein